MKRTLALAALSALAAGCQQRRAKPPAPDAAAVARDARAASRTLDQEGSVATSSAPAPEARLAVKRLGKDPVNGCEWLESEGLVTIGDQDSRAQARAAAQAEARKRAMESFLGVDVTQRSFDFQQETLRGQTQLVESILQTTRNGRIIDEKVLSEGARDVPICPGCRYFVALRSCLVPLPDRADRGFQVDLELSRTRFVDGDEAAIKVTAAKECYAYLYDVGVDGETSLIAPNDYLAEIHLKPGEGWEYPGDDLRRRGVKLVAQLPAGKDISAETIRLVATKAPLLKDGRDPGNGGYLGVLRRLNASGLDWTDAAQAFTIYKR